MTVHHRSSNRSRILKKDSDSSMSSRGIARSLREGDVPIAPRIAIAGVVGTLLFGVLVLRLWALTILGGADYADRANRNQARLLPVEAPRGRILDRSGHAIVINRPARQVVIDLQAAGSKDDVNDMLQYLSGPLGVSVAEMKKRISKAPEGALEPVVLVDDISTKDDYKIWWLAEHERDFPGIRVEIKSMRKYPYGNLAAHILGFVNSVSEDDLKSSHSNLKPYDRVGKAGIERAYDQYLRGANGYQSIQVDAAMRRQDGGILRGLPATPGLDLKTTLDIKLQKRAQNSLASNIARVSKTYDGRDAYSGAVVAMDPNSGAIRAIVSYPTFDPGIFTDPKKSREVSWLYNSKNTRKPSLNRAIAGEFPPASTYKAITGIAAMENDFISPNKLLRCDPFIKIKDVKFKNHDSDPQGYIDMATALETSCDTYFYQLAMKFYSDPGTPLQDWSRKFGLGKPTGLDIGGEMPGLVPDKKWLDSQKHLAAQDRIWKPGFSVNMSIGQGDLRTTPLQMTSVYATIANGGTVHTPHIGDQVQGASGSSAVQLPVDNPKNLNINPVYLASIKDGLEKVANGSRGTASGVFSGFPIHTAGKSGTGEKDKQSDLSWYCGYAPVEKPEIAVCAFIDGGGGGSTAAGPVVKDVFSEWFGLDKKPRVSSKETP